MKTSIFIRSWRGDREWLRYCLLSLQRFAKGFHETIVVIPREDRIHFDKFDFLGARNLWTDDIVGLHGYLNQQITKVHADTYTDSDFILYVDSDCVSFKAFSTGDYICNGKAIQLIRTWEDANGATIWREPTTRALGIVPIFEHMCTMPLIYHRETLRRLRDHMQKLHGKSIGEYISSMSEMGFSEFNLLGSFALRYTPHLFDWRIADMAKDGYCRNMKQHWSHDEISKFTDGFKRDLATC